MATRFESVLAVIPGLAPGLVAILPQLLLLLLAALALVFSPRAWWRLAVAALRRPLWSLAVAGGAAAIVLGASFLLALIPRPAPGAAIARSVSGFPVGDLRSGRAGGRGNGPAGAPLSMPCVPAADGAAAEWLDAELAGGGGQVFVVRADRRKLARLSPGLDRFLWELESSGGLACEPLAFERSLEGGGRQAGAVLIEAAAGESLAAGGRIAVVDGADGRRLGFADLAARPDGAAAIVDDRLLVAIDGALACFSIADPARPRTLWSAARPRRRALGVAGDECRRFWLLDEAGLLAGDLDRAELRPVAALAPGTPRRLAVRSGRAFVLVRESAERVRVLGIDPATSPRDGAGGAAWSTAIEAADGAVGAGVEAIAAASFGVAVTLPRRLVVLDAATGARSRDLELEALVAAPAVLAPGSCYLALSSGEALCYSPRPGRIEWRAGAGARGGSASLLIDGERLLLSMGGALRAFVEERGSAGLEWSQWRGGPGRLGTCSPDAVPLEAAVIWDRALPGTGGRPEVLPLADGWLVLRAGPEASALEWIGEDGERLGALALAGEVRGLARLGTAVFAALETRAGGRALRLQASRDAAEAERLRIVWSAPAAALAAGEVLAAGRDLLFVCEREGLRALDARDGSRRWASADARGARTPLVADRRIVAADDGGALVALDAGSGERLWRQQRPGWRLGAPSAGEDGLWAPASASGGRGVLLSIDPGNGAVRRELPLDGGGRIRGVAVSGGALLAASESGACFLAAASGGAARRLDGTAGAAPVLGFGLIVHASGAALRGLDADSLAIAWEAALAEPIEDLVLERGRIVAATRSRLVCLGAE